MGKVERSRFGGELGASRARGAFWRVGLAALLGVLCAVVCLYFFTSNGKEIPPRAHAPATSSPNQVSEETIAPAAEQPTPKRLFVRGRVVDENEKPIGGARVRLIPSRSGSNGTDSPSDDSIQTEPTIAGNDGAFEIEMPTGAIGAMAWASADGYETANQHVRLGDSDVEGIELVLLRRGSIAGIVVDIGRRPLEHIEVDALALDASNNMHRRTTEVTHSDGNFEIGPLPGGKYSLRARYLPPSTKRFFMAGMPVEPGGSAGDAEPLSTVSINEGERLTGVVLVVPWDSTRRIEGVIVDQTRKPIAGAVAWVEDAERPGRPLAVSAAISGGDGRFRIGVFPETSIAVGSSSFSVHARAKGYEDGVADGARIGDTGITIVLNGSSSGSISGKVLDSGTGKPVPTATVQLEAVARPWGESWGNPNFLNSRLDFGVSRTGRFHFKDVPTGDARLRVYETDYGMSTIEHISVRSNETTEIVIPLTAAGKLEVDVQAVGAIEGMQFGDFALGCVPIDRDGGPSSGLDYTMHEALRGHPVHPTAESPGKRTMALPPGRYGVLVWTAPLVPGEAELVPAATYTYQEAVVESGQTTHLAMVVGGAGVISGFVAPPENEKWVVTLIPGKDALSDFTGGHDDLYRVARTAGVVLSKRIPRSGEFKFIGVPEGAYRAVLGSTSSNARSYVVASKTIEVVGGAELKLEFP